MAAPVGLRFLGNQLDILCIVAPAYKIIHAQNMKCVIRKYNLNFSKQTRTLFMAVLPNSREPKLQKQTENTGAAKLLYSSEQLHRPSRNLKMMKKVSEMVKYEQLKR